MNNSMNSTVNGSVPGAHAWKDFVDGSWQELLFRTPAASMGDAAFAMFIVLAVVAPLYLRGRDPALPAIMLILFTGTLLPMLPATLVGTAWGVIWISIAIALFGLINVFR